MDKEQIIGLKLINKNHLENLKNTFSNFEIEVTNFVSFASWHSYELLVYVLLFCENADVVITTFGLSQEAITVLERLKQNKLIRNINIIINKSSKRYKVPLLFYLKNVVNKVYYNNIHAKIFLISDSTGKTFVVNQSANFSKNPTIESGFISTKQDDYMFFLEQINKIINLSKWN